MPDVKEYLANGEWTWQPLAPDVRSRRLEVSR